MGLGLRIIQVRVRVKDRDNTGYYRLYSVHCHQWKRLRNYFYYETRIREGVHSTPRDNGGGTGLEKNVFFGPSGLSLVLK